MRVSSAFDEVSNAPPEVMTRDVQLFGTRARFKIRGPKPEHNNILVGFVNLKPLDTDTLILDKAYALASDAWVEATELAQFIRLARAYHKLPQPESAS